MGKFVNYRSALLVTCAATCSASPSAALAQTRIFNIPAQAAATGVAELGRQADTQIIISDKDAARRRTNRVVGSYSTERAIELLLSRTGLRMQRSGPNAFIVVETVQAPTVTSAPTAETDTGNVPDILVTGNRGFSLNIGIKRTRDDSQPFVVFDREQIRRSGSTSVEQFLRDFLNTNSQEGTVDQPDQFRQQGQSAVNLRGLGTRDTLILVDGRRQPGVNLGNGNLEQPLITNIPLASIERIEVLASSASGIYGSGASGGVINIILRRDYNGGQISATYADTTDRRAPDKRIDLTLGKSLEGGRSNVSLTLSYHHADPLTYGAREDLVLGPLRSALANNPNFFQTPPIGLTPNFRASPRGDLTLKPEFGGTVLSPGFLFIPPGYRGVAIDGVAPLLANAGKYNFGLGNNAGVSGKDTPLLYGSDRLNGNLAFRREMTSWLRVYGEIAASQSKTVSTINLAPSQVVLPSTAPNNPFNQRLVVDFALPGFERSSRAKNTELRFVGGAIVKLPYKWEALIDLSYSRDRFTVSRQLELIPFSEQAKLNDGTFNILQDVSKVIFPFQVVPVLSPDLAYQSSSRTAVFKIAGPIPFALPGGNPTVVMNIEQDREDFGEAYQPQDNGDNLIQINYTPKRHQTLSSAYGEIRLPFVGPNNHIPMVRQFEVTIAGRYEHYSGVGSGANYLCYFSSDGLPAALDIRNACDPATLNIPTATASNSHIDPTYSLKWTVTPDVIVRGSYATGYLPPQLNQLIGVPGTIFLSATDPLRGGEVIGTPYSFGPLSTIPGVSGGNAKVKPERSKSFSAGVIFTPRAFKGFRFSADYTDITKQDVYASPQPLLFDDGTEASRAAFANFLRLFPDRVTRGPASGGFAVGPITSIDATIVNLAEYRAKAIDFALDYSRPFLKGTLEVAASATRNLLLSFKAFQDSAAVDSTGVVPASTIGNPPFVSGDLKWKGNTTVRWSNETMSIGIRGRYFDGYYLNIDKSIDINTGTDRIASQIYFDVFGSVTLPKRIMLRAGVNNVLNKAPPYVQDRLSRFGDPRLANFYLSLSRDF